MTVTAMVEMNHKLCIGNKMQILVIICSFHIRYQPAIPYLHGGVTFSISQHWGLTVIINLSKSLMFWVKRVSQIEGTLGNKKCIPVSRMFFRVSGVRQLLRHFTLGLQVTLTVQFWHFSSIYYYTIAPHSGFLVWFSLHIILYSQYVLTRYSIS